LENAAPGIIPACFTDTVKVSIGTLQEIYGTSTIPI
jgi:hypothetical protein